MTFLSTNFIPQHVEDCGFFMELVISCHASKIFIQLCSSYNQTNVWSLAFFCLLHQWIRMWLHCAHAPVISLQAKISHALRFISRKTACNTFAHTNCILPMSLSPWLPLQCQLARTTMGWVKIINFTLVWLIKSSLYEVHVKSALREEVEVATAPNRYQTGEGLHVGAVQMLTVLYGVQEGAAHLYQTHR